MTKHTQLLDALNKMKETEILTRGRRQTLEEQLNKDTELLKESLPSLKTADPTLYNLIVAYLSNPNDAKAVADVRNHIEAVVLEFKGNSDGTNTNLI